MADFAFNVLAQSPDRLNVVSSKLGPNVATKYTQLDTGKAVKLGAAANHVMCAAGDELEGFIDSVDAATAQGFSFGGVARCTRGSRVDAQVGAGQAGNLALGALVVADTQLAIGTKGRAQVKAGAPAVNKWRVINVRGTGAAGTMVVLELL
jgi:hypothetical protein